MVPDGSTDFEVQDLKVGTRYSFSIMAFNSLGDSGYTQDIGKVETKSKNNLPFANWMFSLRALGLKSQGVAEGVRIFFWFV